MTPVSDSRPLRDVAALFVRLGLTAFGGPAAHIALMEEECVRRRRWITRDQFLDVLGAANLIPGPTSTELAMHVGLRRAGWAGLVVAGICFIVPPSVVVGVLAALYVQVGQLPSFEGILRALKPVVVVIVLQAFIGLSRTALRSVPLVLLTVVAAVAAAAGLSEVAVLLGAGVIHMAIGRRAIPVATVVLLAIPLGLIAASTGATVPLPSLFGYFLKVGSEIFGSGYVLFAVLRGDLVDHHHWLTQGQLLDAIAVGQITPGPLFTSATFIGYLLGGPVGAVIATVAIFLPAFVFTALSAGALHRLRRSPIARAFLEGVNAAAVALIALVTLSLARTAIADLPTVAIALLAAVLVGWLRLNSSWVLAAAAISGLFLYPSLN